MSTKIKSRFEMAMERAWEDFCSKFPSLGTEVNKPIFEIGFGYGSEFGFEFGVMIGAVNAGRRETKRVSDVERY